MFDIQNEVLEWGGKKLTIETGRVARQAHGSVIATYGGTSVLATVVADREEKKGLDFFPLTVNYQEKAYAAGKIPGGFFKREGRPSEKETLVSRLIDRPIRPLFADGFKCETQVIATVISYDNENDPDIVSLIACSAALTLSGVPFMGPIGAARVGFKDGDFILNPTKEEMETSALDLVVAGTKDAVLMVESEAKELSEEQMLGAVTFGQDNFSQVIDAIISLAEKAAKEPRDFEKKDISDIENKVSSAIKDDLSEAYKEADKQKRTEKIAEIKKNLISELVSDDDEDEDYNESTISSAFKTIEKNIVRNNILDTGERIDGRDLETVRPIQSDVSVLPLTHGSALFTRGETQALVVTTLGTGDDEKFVDGLDETYKERFMLHYNFPPYSVGETGRTGFTGRREIGHGKLAWRALQAVMPEYDDFPYTIRLVSEITESNGSSSMATVCGSSLSMMDAGIPLSKPVAGIAMGLIKEDDRVAVLSDILGDEDHLGDMDFKVAGTNDGITSLQMDIKITGITKDIMETALSQAKNGRIHILEEMAKALDKARDTVNSNAPRIETINVPTDKIREVIGAGGKVIREIVEESGAKVDINDDGGLTSGVTEVKNLDTLDVISLRVFNDHLYVLTTTVSSDQAIYKMQILDDSGSLGDMELVFDWSAYTNKLSSALCFTLSEAGDLFVGSDSDDQPLTYIQNGNASGFYSSILTAPISYMAWGNSNYLYLINKTEETNRVQRVDTRMSGADYYGRP